MNPMDAVETARKVVDVLLDLLDGNEALASQLLSDAAIRRANKAADTAENLKFGGPTPSSDDE